MKVRRELAEWTYILKAEQDLPPAEQTRWTLRPLTFKEDTALVNRIEQSMAGGNTAKLALEAGLLGFENLRYQDGDCEEIAVETVPRTPLGVRVRSVTTAILDLISSKDRHEIAQAIIEHGRTSEDDEKN